MSLVKLIMKYFMMVAMIIVYNVFINNNTVLIGRL